MAVCEWEEIRRKNPADTERWGDSLGRLSAVGIDAERVVHVAVRHLRSGGGGARVGNGMGTLPIAVYRGVPVSVGKYPSDQGLANHLDDPDGVLSANKEKAPAMPNDMARCRCSFVNTPSGR